ncbi:ESCRT-0 subunit protein hse1 [Linnemannia zychae]|nr:ESCRT-0 subunit protein hse1 [Linnemannia zychae]
MAEAACSHILQSLQGHVIFLTNQGLLTEDSCSIILNELCNLDLQAISASSFNNKANSTNNNSSSSPYASKQHTALQQESQQHGRPSMDTELQMLVVPPKSAVVPISQPTPSPPSSDYSNSSNDNDHHTTLHRHTPDEDSDSESDDEDLRDSDLAHQERLLRQEQNTDIVTGELDNLIAASATDLEESEVGVLEGADDNEDGEESEVQLERSLSSPSQKPELPPLLFSNSSYNRSGSFDFSSGPLTNIASERPLDLHKSSGTSVAPPTVSAIVSNPAPDNAITAVPHSHSLPSQGSIQPTTNAAVTSPTVAPTQIKQDTLSPSIKPTLSSTTTTTETTTRATTVTTTATAAPVPQMQTALPPPSANLERYEHHNFSPAQISTAVSTSTPIAAPNSTSTNVAPSITTAGSTHVNVPVTFQHNVPASAGSFHSPSYSMPIPDQQPTIYNPNQAAPPPVPVVYQPPVMSQTQQTALRQIPTTSAEEHTAAPHGKHGHDHSFSRHLHDASASTAFTNDGKDSMTSIDSAKPSETAPTPPPKDDTQKPITYQPPSSVQPLQGMPHPAPLGPLSQHDPTMPQPLAMPVQAYQLYQPKPYQPKTTPSVKLPPKQARAQAQANAQAQAQELTSSAGTAPSEPQIHQQPIQVQPQPQPQPSSQPQPQHSEPAQAPFQGQAPVPGLAQQQPELQQQQVQAQASVPGLVQQSPEQQQQQMFQQQYHLQQQYQAQQQMQHQQQQQFNVGNSGPPSATSSANESATASKSGKGWMSGIRTSFLPKGHKKDNKESKETKGQHVTQDSPAPVVPVPASFQPHAPFGHQQQFGQQQHQYHQQPPFAGGQVLGQAPPNGANFGIPSGGTPVSQREGTIGSTPTNSGPLAATSGPALVSIPGRQDSFQSEASAQVAAPQFQQQHGTHQHIQQQQSFQQQQQYQQQFQAQQQHQLHQQNQSPYAANASQSTVPGAASTTQQQQPLASAAPTIVAPAEHQNAHPNQEKSLRRLSDVSNASFNNASLRPETIEAANAATAAIQAARLSTSGGSSPLQPKADTLAANPYQQQQQQQQEQQPMVAQQEQRQQAPGSPLSDAGSRVSDYSGTSEVRNLEVIARAQALFDFPGEDPGDLPFKVGDIINVIEFLNDDWWRGTLRKELGIFPTAYVQKLSPPANGGYPKISVTVRQSMILPSPTDQSPPSSLQQQASFRASYQPSSLEAPTSAITTPAPIATVAPVSNPAPAAAEASAPGGGSSFPAPPPSSSSFPAPPPGSTTMSPTASSVFTYFPNSGNQPPISPPPSMRNQSQPLPFAQGQPGQEAPMGYGPTGSQPLSPTSPQQGRFSQQQQQSMMQFQQPGQPGQHQQYQQYGQVPYQYNQQQQPMSPNTSGTPGPIGANSHMTTAQMAAAAKSKKKFGSKW